MDLIENAISDASIDFGVLIIRVWLIIFSNNLSQFLRIVLEEEKTHDVDHSSHSLAVYRTYSKKPPNQ